MSTHDIVIDVAPRNGQPQRLVVAIFGAGGEHRDTLNTDSATSRGRFIAALAGKLGADAADLSHLDAEIIRAADAADDELEAARAERGDDGDGKKPSQATLLVGLAMDAGVELWHAPDQTCFATTPADGHREHWPIRSKAFRLFTQRLYHRAFEAAPGGQAVADALGVLEGKALFDGAEHAVHVRVAGHEGRLFLDLTDPDWQAVEIDAAGWRITSDPPVRFRRAKAMLALPTPVAGGAVDELRELVNVADGDWPLLLAWLVAALRPTGPFPVLVLAGEQGSGKSTAARMLRLLIDPSSAPLRAAPREPRDLMIASNNSWAVALDNLSDIPPWLSDALCRLSTGGGFSTRTLYENDDETIFDAQRPVALNGIEVVAERPDLLDRSLLVSLPTIPEAQRRTEAALWQAFDAARPRILGALLTAASAALRRLPDVRLERLPRMADFGLWGAAAEPALGLADGAFISAYGANRADVNALAVEASVLARPLIELASRPGGWSGTASDLLAALDDAWREAASIDGPTRRPDGWPRNPRAMAGQIKRLAPVLRAEGVGVEFVRTGRSRTRTIYLRLEREGKFASAPSASSADAKMPGKTGVPADDAADANPDAPLLRPQFASAGNGEIPEENGGADAKDDTDAKKRLCSKSAGPDRRRVRI